MSKERSKTLRFTRIHLENWRNFKKVDVKLQQRVFLVGPNASGKSNFLDAFRFLHDIVAQYGGFQEAVHKRGDVDGLLCKASKMRSNIVVDVTIGNSTTLDEWRYEIHINQRRSSPCVKVERVFKRGKLKIERPDGQDKKDRKRLTQTFLEQSHANLKFREVADFLETIKYLHVIPQIVKEPEKFIYDSCDVGVEFLDYGGELIDEALYVPENTAREYIDLLNSILRKAIPHFKELSIGEGEWGKRHFYVTFKHWLKEHLSHDERDLSDGTIRLMASLWALFKGEGPLLFEEPELSLHPEVIRHIPQILHKFQRRNGRQILISTHSPDLLQDEGIGLDEVLLLIPSDEGTIVKPAGDFEEIKLLLEGGLNLADAVFPLTQPENAHQLSLFGED